MKKSDHISPDLLLRQTEGAQLPEIVAHVRQCSFCAERYVRLTLQRRARTVTAPEEIWSRVQAKLNNERSLAQAGSRFPFWPIFAAALILCAVAALVIGDVVYERKRPATSLDLGRYISVLEKSSAAPNGENARDALFGLVPYDQQAALRETGVRPQVDEYRLRDQRAFISKNGKVFELAYQSASDSFVVFVAPQAAKLGFGNYHLVTAEIRGVHCQRVQCPRQDIFWTTANGRQYVFFRMHSSLSPSADLLAELISLN